jgi:lipooligosaccharide transport system ATP-binding protein
MDEAEQLCDRLVVMDGGVVVAEGSPAELIARYSTREVLELRFPVGEAAPVEVVGRLADRVEVLPDRLLLYTADGDHLQGELARRGVRSLAAQVRRSSLEDVFLRLTGRTLVD